MSMFKNYQTQMTDEESLCESLSTAGIKFKRHQAPVQLKGWGRSSAEIVIGKKVFGNYYEAGFAKQANGTFNLVAADDDAHKLDLAAVRRGYTESRTKHMAAAKGMKFVRREQSTDKQGKTNVKLIFQAAANAAK